MENENYCCGICCKSWIDKDPRILPCQHSFCFECLEYLPLNNFNITCPVCKVNVYIEDGDIYALTKNQSDDNHGYHKEKENRQKNETSLKLDNFQPSETNTDDTDFLCVLETATTSFEISSKTEKLENSFYSSINIIDFLLNQIKKDSSIVIKGVKFHRFDKNIIEFLSNHTINLENLYCNKNFIKKENIHHISSLIKQNVNIKIIDLSKNEEFGCINNDIFRNLWNSSETLQDLILFKCKLQEDDIKNLSSLLQICKSLKNINLGMNEQIGHSNREFFENFYNFAATLESLNLFKCNLNEENIRTISDLLIHCTNLKNINFGSNKNFGITTNSVFKNLCQSSATLENLNFSDCDLDGESIKDLPLLLYNCSNLKSFNFSSNRKIGSTTLPIFKNLSHSSATLENLDFVYGLNGTNLKNLSNLLLKCTQIKSINLSGNGYVGETSHLIFQRLIHSAATLKILKLNGCLNDENLSSLSNLLSHCNNLEDIQFCAKRIGSCKSIFENLGKSSATLQHLNLSSCNLQVNTMNAISNFFSRCQNLKSIDLCNNYELNCVNHRIFESLSKSSVSLEIFNFDATFTTSHETCHEVKKNHLSDLLSKCTNLRKVILIGIKCHDSTFESLISSLRHSSATLEKLNFRLPENIKKKFNNLSNLFPNCQNLKFD